MPSYKISHSIWKTPVLKTIAIQFYFQPYLRKLHVPKPLKFVKLASLGFCVKRIVQWLFLLWKTVTIVAGNLSIVLNIKKVNEVLTSKVLNVG